MLMYNNLKTAFKRTAVNYLATREYNFLRVLMGFSNHLSAQLLTACGYYIMFHVLTHFLYPFLAAIVSCTRTMPKRKSSAYYSQLAKRQFSSIDSMRSHMDSTRVSLDALAHVDSPRVSVDATSCIECCGSKSSDICSNPFIMFTLVFYR